MGSATLRRPAPLPALTRAGLTALLLALAAAAWVLTVRRMNGMDAGPGTELGALGWFAVSWLLMMAAMMLPSLVPAALAFARGGERSVAAFVTGYLGAWTAAGIVAYLVFEGVRSLDLGFLGWDGAGRYVAAGVIVAAAAYELTPIKARFLGHCRSPLAVAGDERPAGGGLRGGVRFGGYCIACCVGLMAALFALGVMSVTWMVVVAVLIGAERLLPWRTPAVYAVAVALVVLGVWVAVAPGDLPGLTLPGSMGMT
jgi:predicted metal-binding membrane protein